VNDDWRRRAACRDRGELFYDAADHRAVAEAKAICAGCPVFERCRAFADETEGSFLFGIWAGESASERRERRRRSLDLPGASAP
jgi:WhiB family transcriptional regulator, redox-sensing transcriptional regulator